ncbi:MAG: PAS domain-containing protein [Verrucomicrobia bacterium]|nr:PAS domain-containing protein [Verrucomicrobiota bacterium]
MNRAAVTVRIRLELIRAVIRMHHDVSADAPPAGRRHFGPFWTALTFLAGLVCSLQAAGQLQLTPAEQVWLRMHPVWRAAGGPSPPFQWIDEQGKFQGMAADYKRLIEGRLGVSIKPLPAPSWSDSLEQLRRQECDLSFLTAHTPDREAFLLFTDELLVLPLVILTRSDDHHIAALRDLAGKPVAIARNWPIHEYLKRDHPEIALVPRDDVGSAISAVALGNAEAFVGDLASATNALETLGVQNLKVAGETAYVAPFRIAVRKDWPEAVTILNKAIHAITPAEQAEIRRRWISVRQEGVSLQRVLTIAVPALIGAVIVTLLVANRHLAREIQRRRRTEAALKASEERWSFALEGSGDGVWDWNVKTNQVFFSKRWKALLGFEEHELANRFEEWASRVHPDDFERVTAEVGRYLSGVAETGYETEHRMKTKDGSYRWILARGRLVSRAEDGTPLRMVGTHRDVTSRRQAEEELRQYREHLEGTVAARTAQLIEQHETLASVLDATPESVLLLDASGRVLTCNEVAAARFKKKVSEVIGAHYSTLLAPETLPRYERLIRRTLETSTMVSDQDGCEPSGRHFRTCCNPILNARNEVTGLAVLAVDITELKRAEQRIQEAESRLRDITDSIPGALYQCVMGQDGALAFTFSSEGVRDLIGVEAESAVRDAKTVFDMFHPEDVALAHEKARASAETMTRYTQDLRVCHPDGRMTWVRAEAVPRRMPDGTTLWNGHVTDITHRKRLEEELAKAKTAAEAANRAKSIFLAQMSHEIRTPMNAILGFSQLMMREAALSPTQRRHLETINRSGEHLLTVINDILEMSKIEAGRISLQPGTFDLYAMLDDLERMFRVRAEGRQIRFSVKRTGHVPQFVHADEGKLRQIFINLIGNAVKFTERGSVVARLGAVDGPGRSLRLHGEVEDTGPGISTAELPKLFKQFEQTATGARSGEGTGLGLAISREFVRLMGGEIHVTSKPGQGTTFRFELVVEKGDAAALGLKPHDGQAVCLRPGQRPLWALIADDKVENRTLFQEVLQSAGFETIAAEDGAQAIEEFSRWQPQVVLMDLRMPVLDGREAIRRIRALPGGAATSIIAVTASAFEDDRREAIEAGANDFLSKPFRNRDLLEKIGRMTGAEYAFGNVGPDIDAGHSLVADATDAFSSDLRDRLYQAAIRADFDELRGLLDQAAAHAPDVAGRLREQLERFDYPGMLALLQPGEIEV